MVPTRPSLPLLVALAAVALAPVVGAIPATPDSSQPALVHDSVDDPDGNVTVLRGHAGRLGSLSSPAAIQAARENGTLRRAPALVRGEMLVLAFTSARVQDRLATTDGTNTTDRFFALRNSTAINVSVEGRGHGTEQLPADMTLTRSSTEVVVANETDRIWLLVDTGRVDLVDRRDREPVRRDLDYFEFAAVVEIPTADGEHRVLTGQSRFLPPSVALRSPNRGTHLEGMPATVRANVTGNLTVTGRSPVLGGTELSVSAVTPNGTVLATETVVTGYGNQSDPGNATGSVDGDERSTFRAVLDMPRLENDDVFRLAVTRDNQTLAEPRVAVGGPPKMWNTTAAYRPEADGDRPILVEATLRLPADGFLVVYVGDEARSTPVPADRTVDASLRVDRSGVEEDGDVYLLAVWDADRDGELDRDPDRLFRTSADAGAAGTTRELEGLVPVSALPANWTSGTTTSTQSTAGSTSQTTASTGQTSPTGRSSTTTPRTSTTTPGLEWPVAIAGVLAIAVLWLFRR